MYRNNYITRPPKMYSSTTDKVNKLDNKIMDKVGLKRAYETKSGLYQHGNNLYIAGTRDFRDVIDDSKLPFDKGARNSKRYEEVKQYLDEHPEINNLIGHSLGGAVALQGNKDNPNKYNIVTYGSPAVNSSFIKDDSNIKRFRNSGDPISMLDGKATDMNNNKIGNFNYILGLIGNKINPLHPLEILNYTIRQHSYNNSDHMTQ